MECGLKWEFTGKFFPLTRESDLLNNKELAMKKYLFMIGYMSILLLGCVNQTPSPGVTE